MIGKPAGCPPDEGRSRSGVVLDSPDARELGRRDGQGGLAGGRVLSIVWAMMARTYAIPGT